MPHFLAVVVCVCVSVMVQYSLRGYEPRYTCVPEYSTRETQSIASRHTSRELLRALVQRGNDARMPRRIKAC